ncbi:hypothetical protein SNEBB_002340 [Seison nebaliae]|nr:hypothetical protein SNEBB_002340 [Seison nebaliae]
MSTSNASAAITNVRNKFTSILPQKLLKTKSATNYDYPKQQPVESQSIPNDGVDAEQLSERLEELANQPTIVHPKAYHALSDDESVQNIDDNQSKFQNKLNVTRMKSAKFFSDAKLRTGDMLYDGRRNFKNFRTTIKRQLNEK